MSNNQKKIGRPLLDINADEVREMAEAGCNDSEIGDFLGCAHTTISRRFAQDLVKSRVTLKKRLRAKQVEMALEGDKTMLIWLGKQMLGQRDSPAVAIQNNIAGPAQVRSRTAEEDQKFIAMCNTVKDERAAKDKARILTD